jgi:predicted nucleic acid-binding protein
LTTFIDTSVLFAAANIRDQHNGRAKSILTEVTTPVLTDHVLIETWRLLRDHMHGQAAEQFWYGLRRGAARIENTITSDLERAWEIGEAFADQEFSIVDRTSFAVMERLGITKAASFDVHFAIYRYGRDRNKAFEIVR